MDHELIRELLIKYQLGNCTPEEKKLIDHWYFNEISRQPVPAAPDDALLEEQIIWERILAELPAEAKVRHLKKWYLIVAAATILLFLSIGLYFMSNKKVARDQLAGNHNPQNEIVPGGNKAILTLANGKQIVLTGAQNGTIAQQGAITINKTANGQIVYGDLPKSGAQPSPSDANDLNTITTPAGGQYTVILPDGSKVFLNAASSLTYPVAFSGNERKVQLKGEAYFEVVHNALKPFRVVSNGQTVEVLGTHFNIDAYSDESLIKTTLLEGSVRVSKGGRVAMLRPGQQSQVANGATSPQINVANVDAEDAVAWKSGLFIFDGDNIQHIMQMISRWYNVDVSYSGAIPDDIFGGSVSRFSNVSDVLKALQLTGKVNFKIEGRKIVVSK
jgi:hypothetical protein